MGDIIRKRKGGKDLGWYIRWSENGRRRQLASHQPTYVLAKRMLLQIEARVARGMAGIEEPSLAQELTFAELLQRFLCDFTSPRIKDVAQYKAQMRRVLERLLPHLGQLPLARLGAAQIARARDALSQKYQPGTVRTTLISLSALLSWAVKQGLLQLNPAREVQRPPSPAPRIDFLSLDEVRSLLAAAEQRARTLPGPKGIAWWSRWIAISLALRLGLRKGELFGLRWQDVDLESGRLRVAHSYATTPKSGQPRHLRLPAALVPLLREWRELCPRTKLALVCPVRLRGTWQMPADSAAAHGLVGLLRAAGCRTLTRPWHLLRHTMASHFLQSGGSLVALSQILGHRDVKVTMIYAHLSGDYLADQLDKIKY